MTETEPYAPHETRMLALQMAIEFINGDSQKSAVWKTEEVISIARKFEKYLTDQPIKGFVAAA